MKILSFLIPASMRAYSVNLVMEQADAVEAHYHVVLVGGFDYLIVTD